MALPATILIVDDEAGSRESLRMILKPYYEVHTAGNGKEALYILRRTSVDLVTLDLSMPLMHGSDVLREIKEHDPNIEVIIVTGFGTLKSATEAIRYGVFDYILKPFNVANIISVVKRSVDKRNVHRRQKDILMRLESICLPDESAGFNGEAGVDDEKIFTEVGQVLTQSANGLYYDPGSVDYLEFVKVLSATLENKDQYTHGHSDRVNYYSQIMAQRIDLTPEQAAELQIAALLHDIGKIGVSNAHILKDGRLTDQEREIVRQHPEKGVELVAPLKLPSSIVSTIRHHHEWFNGQGYPSGIAGEEISVSARILSIADAFDAMTSDRPYRKSMSRNEVLRELRKGRNVQFDGALVDEFVGLLQSEDFASTGHELPKASPKSLPN